MTYIVFILLLIIRENSVVILTRHSRHTRRRKFVYYVERMQSLWHSLETNFVTVKMGAACFLETKWHTTLYSIIAQKIIVWATPNVKREIWRPLWHEVKCVVQYTSNMSDNVCIKLTFQACSWTRGYTLGSSVWNSKED
jgi:hypothetical protein